MTAPTLTSVEKNMARAALVLLLIGCVLIIRPFISALLWAAVLCFATWPLYVRLLNMLKGRRTLAAFIMTVAMVVTLLLPFVIIGISLADNVRELSAAVQTWLASGPPKPPKWLASVPVVGERAVEYWTTMASDTGKLLAKVRQLLQPLSGVLLRAGIILGAGVFELTLSLLIAFFFFRDGAAAAKHLRWGMERIGGERGTQLLDVAGQTVRGVVHGILGTALAQGVMAGIGFLIAGVPGAALLALLTFFLSVVPAGPPLIWIPAAMWLFNQGRPGWGIFMVVWGVGVSSIDNVVKPWLISQGSDMPFLLILFGVLGGAIAFGFIGVFLGPTLLAVAYRIVQEWFARSSKRSVTEPAEVKPVIVDGAAS
jgi:predicted PurR-regulated permease PerM